MSRPLKFVVAGPKGSGKTIISNYISGHSDALSNENKKYEPTSGVRILEFETRVSNSNNPLNIEIWDTSGDHSFESCWRAIMNEADGVILVYNPDIVSQDQQMSDWYEYFVKRNGLKDSQCLIFAHKSSTTGANSASSSSSSFKPPPLFTKVTAALTTSQSGADIKSMFESLVKEIHSNKMRK